MVDWDIDRRTASDDFVQEPLSLLIEKKKDWMPEKGHVHSREVFELFEILLSFITNTMSFIRVGAFALNHVGMMSVVFCCRIWRRAAVLWYRCYGNLLVIGLEGLIVGIQVLRLEYYEMFSRFFVGDGKEFQNINQKVNGGLAMLVTITSIALILSVAVPLAAYLKMGKSTGRVCSPRT